MKQFTNERKTYVDVLVTPEMAADFLSRNAFKNRPMSKNCVQSYVSDIKNGRWSNRSNDALCFNEAGQLVNGQHRLTALVKSGASQVFDIKTGLTESEVRAIDSGKKRTSGDILSMAGVPNARVLAAGIARARRLENGNRSLDVHDGASKMTSEDIFATYSADSDFYDNVARIAGVLHDKIMVMKQSEIIAYLIFIVKSKKWPLDIAVSFFRAIEPNRPNPNPTGACLYRKLLEPMTNNKMAMTFTHRMNLICYAFNCFASGAERSKFVISDKIIEINECPLLIR